MGRIEIYAIAAILAFGAFQYIDHLRGELREQKAAVAEKEGELKTLRDEAKAAEIGRAVAENSKERVREVVRTVTIPAASAACRDDPAYGAAWDRIERMRRAAEGGGPDPAAPAPHDEPPRGTVSRTRPNG